MADGHTSSHAPVAETRRNILDVFEKHWSLLFFNRGANGKMMGRPMARAKVDEDGTIYLSTGIDSKKVRELQKDPAVVLAYMDANEYVVMSGRARISRDRALIDELWKDSWKLWYPEGKDDEAIAIVVVTPTDGTHWNQTGTQGLSFLFRVMKARLTGKEVEYDGGDAAHVSMKPRKKAKRKTAARKKAPAAKRGAKKKTAARTSARKATKKKATKARTSNAKKAGKATRRR